ncbi:MAG: methyltransferase [Verrucomicrobiia bacterium]
MDKTNSPTPDRIMQLAWGYAAPLIIEAAVEHRVFDQLEGGPRSLEELVFATGASRRGLRAILDALTGLELLTKFGPKYALAPESAAFLVSGKPGYHGGFFRHISNQLLPRWLGLSEVVRTGRPNAELNEASGGAEFFAEFVEALVPLSYAAAQKLGEHLGIAESTEPLSVLDLGAGSGVWGIALAEQSPLVHVRAVDWPRVLEVTRRTAQRFHVDDRFVLAAGDLLEADFGTGHEVATLGHILHSEGRERSRRLLKRVFDALAPGGTVAIMEFVPNDDRTGPPAPLLFAVNMLVNTAEGDTFTFAEMSTWLREAGFVNPRLLDVPAVSPLVLATRP